MLDIKKLSRRLTAWLSDGAMHNGEQQPLTHVRLMHVTDHGDVPVQGWPISEKTNVDIVTRDMREVAAGDAEGYKGEEQQYYFAAFFGDASPESLGYGARMTFKMFIPADANEENQQITGSESVTPKGMLAANQGHLRDVMRITFGPIDSNTRSMQREIEQLREENAQLRSESYKVIELQQNLMNQETQRRLEERKYAFWEQKKEEVAGIILPLLPAAIGQLIKALGAKDVEVSGGMSPEVIAFREFLKQLDNDQWDALIGNPERGITGILKGPQAFMFKGAMKKFMDMDTESEEKVQERLREITGERKGDAP